MSSGQRQQINKMYNVSIPKGAIMSLFLFCTWCFIYSFNSKRCDYEIECGELSDQLQNSFNSKRCDYEDAYRTKVKNQYLCFNSKRCDYEEIQDKLNLAQKLVSIPKGAIMSTLQESSWANTPCFNSKRCDYESPQHSSKVHYLCFNSKRCDYEFALRYFWN